MKKKNQGSRDMNDEDREWDMKKIIKDIENFTGSHMTWKERKEVENRKVVSLGGKAPKKQRLPLSVARFQMKKQKETEQKMLEMREHESMVLGRFGGSRGARRSTEKRRPEERVLRPTEGHFKNGVLDVKRLLNQGPSRDDDSSSHKGGKGKKKKHGGRKNKGKKKGGGRKHH